MINVEAAVRDLLRTVRSMLRGRPRGSGRGGLGVGHRLALGIHVRLLRACFGIGMARGRVGRSQERIQRGCRSKMVVPDGARGGG